MFDSKTLEIAEKLKKTTEASCSNSLKRFGKKEMLSKKSDIEIKPIYTPLDIDNISFDEIGVPGEYPYKRGLYPLQYQLQPWVNFQVHGYGSPEDTHERMMTLAKQGMKGYFNKLAFNLIFDLPTQAGLDPDHLAARGRVGKSGISIATVEDMDLLLKDLPLDKIQVSLISFKCHAILGLFLALAQRRGIPFQMLRGNSMNFGSYSSMYADKRSAPPRKCIKDMVELIRFCTEEMPEWNTTNLVGYNFSEAGANATQELAFSFAVGMAVIDEAIATGLEPDQFIPRISFQFSAKSDFFETIAKLRCARMFWAELNKKRYSCKNPKSLQARMHVHTSGASLTAQQPLNNIGRSTLHTLAAVLGGANSIMVSAYDEALSIPTEEAAIQSLRLQQIILNETEVTQVTDPLGGSYYLEWLTEKILEGVKKWLDEIEKVGGFYKAWDDGWFRKVIEQEAAKEKEALEKGEKIIVGINKYVEDNKQDLNEFHIFREKEETEEKIIKKIKEYKKSRDQEQVNKALLGLENAVKKEDKIMETIIEAYNANCTLGEVCRIVYPYESY